MINYQVHYQSRYHYPYSYFSPNRISRSRKTSSILDENFPWHGTHNSRVKPARSWSSPAVRSQNCCATCHFVTLDDIFSAGGRRPSRTCGGYRHVPSGKLAMTMHWAGVFLQKMAKNHPANASSREIIKAHMAQWSCHVAQPSYHLSFEGI